MNTAHYTVSRFISLFAPSRSAICLVSLLLQATLDTRLIIMDHILLTLKQHCRLSTGTVTLVDCIHIGMGQHDIVSPKRYQIDTNEVQSNLLNNNFDDLE